MTGKISKNGDILSIPISQDLCACAQILLKKNILYVVVFSELRRCGTINPDMIKSSSPVLVGWTMDAKIRRGDWVLVSRYPPISWDHLKKNYQVEYNGKTWIEDFNGKLLHPASEKEAKEFFQKSSYSPVRFERAIRAYNKLEAWDAEFDDLLVKN
jgi:hypothetical protein